MQTHLEITVTQDFNAFMLELRAAEARLDIEPGLAQYVELAREAAFRAGWHAGQRFQEHHDAEAPTVRCPAVRTVRGLVELGAHAWVQPLAIIEHIESGECFVDPRFTTTPEPTARCCVEIVVTAAGLVASGPPNLHRLSPEVDRERLRPLVAFETLASE